MRIDSPRYRDALSNLGPEPAVFTEPPTRFREWLNEKRLPTEFAEFLAGNTICDNLPFADGAGGIWTPADMMTLNDQESAILASGLFAVGNAINGDFIVIDLTEGNDQVGFVSHDELWENPPANVREIFVPVDRSIHEMLVGISSQLRAWMAGGSDEPNYPIDYCSALERKQDE
jgi:hypothetical protein